jgi:hypothetical protein
MAQAISLSGPSLLIRHGMAWPAEHRYILDVLVREHLGLDYAAQPVAGLNWVEIRCPQAGENRLLVLGANLLLQSREHWLSPRTLPVLPLAQWDPQPLLPQWHLRPLPVIYPPVLPVSALDQHRSALFLPLDLLGGAFFLLTRYEELVLKHRDKHQRFPVHQSLASQAAFLLRPLVDEYVELLRQALRHCFGEVKCRQHQPRIRLSHDIDHPFQFFRKPLSWMLLSAGKWLYHHPRPSEAWRLLRAAQRSGMAENMAADPFNTYSSLMDASEAMGTPAEFYFMTAVTNKRYEESYDLLQPELQQVLRQIHSRGHTIGLHASYESFRSAATVDSELSALLRAAKCAGIQLQSVGGRQHYLRWEPPTTWRCWDQVGLAYDATLGFAEQVGFRCGTAREFPVFDATRSQPLRLRERPLLAMDVTLTYCMALSLEETLAQLQSLWNTVSQLGGTLEVLIHNCHPAARQMAKALTELKLGSRIAQSQMPQESFTI